MTTLLILILFGCVTVLAYAIWESHRKHTNAMNVLRGEVATVRAWLRDLRGANKQPPAPPATPPPS